MEYCRCGHFADDHHSLASGRAFCVARVGVTCKCTGFVATRSDMTPAAVEAQTLAPHFNSVQAVTHAAKVLRARRNALSARLCRLTDTTAGAHARERLTRDIMAHDAALDTLDALVLALDPSR